MNNNRKTYSQVLSNGPMMAFLISTVMLCSAWAFQYIGDLAPCQMCYWQRDAHKGVMAISLLAMLQNKFGVNTALSQILAKLIPIAFLVSFGVAFWHVGVEYQWWEGPKTCLTSTPKTSYNPESLLDSLNEPIKALSCEDVAWSLMGISMAGWNALISLIAAFISLKLLKAKGSS